MRWRSSIAYRVSRITNRPAYCRQWPPYPERRVCCARSFFIDKQLGSLDGGEICNYLKQNLATKNISIILTTASTRLERFAEEACADAFLEKPFGIAEVRKLIDKFL